MKSSSWIIVSNFLFYSSYTVIFLHPFFYLRDANLEAAIVLGMALFGMLYVGGIYRGGDRRTPRTRRLWRPCY